MATIALAMIGSAIGGAAMPASLSLFGATITGAAIGQAVGGAIGSMVDQALFAPRPPDTEGPRLENATFSHADEGAPIPRLYATTRPSCPLIWATQFFEEATTEDVGGKGGMMGGGQSHTSYAYSISFAVAVGERGSGITRLFPDGQDLGELVRTPHPHGETITAKDGTVRVTFYDGTQTEPDPLIEEVEGEAPAYTGTAYLVFDGLPLADHGNRLPMISAEAVRNLTPPNLRALLERIAADCGVEIDASAAPERPITGYKIDRAMSPRAALEGAMGLYQLTAAVRDDGALRITPMQGEPILTIDEVDLVEGEDGKAPLTLKIARSDDAPGEIILNYSDPDREFQPAEVRARRRTVGADGTTSIQTALVLPRAEAASLAWDALVTGAQGRETVSGVLPPSLADQLRPGDFLAIRSRSGRLYNIRLGRASWEGKAPFEGVVTAMTPPGARIAGGNGAIVDPVSGYGPVDLVFLDLPLLRGDEQPHAPHVAAWAEPWAGAVLYRSTGGGTYRASALLRDRATLGALVAPLLAPAAPWVWDAAAELLVDLRSGSLSSATAEAVETGANAAALEWPGGWEILQWRTAELVSPGRWRLSHLRRGMRGTEFLVSGAAPIGARLVRLNGAVIQTDLPPTMRNVSQDWLWGPSNRPRDHASYQGESRAFAGVGLRPYAPAALAGVMTSGDLALTWTRRSRGEPDIWTAPEPPLNEEAESYRVEIRLGSVVIRTADVTSPSYLYAAADMLADGATSPATLEISVRQRSAAFGPGAPARTIIDI